MTHSHLRDRLPCAVGSGLSGSSPRAPEGKADNLSVIEIRLRRVQGWLKVEGAGETEGKIVHVSRSGNTTGLVAAKVRWIL